MSTNCPRCGYILLSSDAPCPRCVDMHQMAVKLRGREQAMPGQHRAKARPTRPTPKTSVAPQYIPPPPTDPNPPGYRWSKIDGRWMPAKYLDEQDRKCAIGMIAMFVIAVFIVVGAMIANAPR